MTLRGDTLKRDSNPQEIEVLTLKDFLRAFNYDNFAKRACELIKVEFKTCLAVMLSKQRTIENNAKESSA